MPSIDLAGVKSQLSSSLTSFKGLNSDFSSQSSGFASPLLPEIKKLGDAIPSLVGTLDRAIAGIGSSITSISSTALPKMQSMVENLIPKTGDVKDLCDSALKKINGGLAPASPALKDTLGKLSTESTKVSEVSKTVSEEKKTNNLQAQSEMSELISEISGLSDVLGGYSSEVGQYLFNPTGGTVPHFSQATMSIKMDQLQTTADSFKTTGQGLDSGAITSTLYKAAGVLRENFIRGNTKSFLYQKAELELGAYTEEVSGDAGKAINRTRNATPEQNSGI